MSIFDQQREALRFQLSILAPLHAPRAAERFAHVDEETVDMMLEQAARFSAEKLFPLAATGDLEGCRLEGGAVRLPAGTPAVWREWCGLGFPLLALPPEYDGLDFPTAVQCAVQEIGDAANMAFGMLAINLRCAALALLRNAPELAARWVPRLVSGECASTIVISEPQAGSDVGRISTAARPSGDDEGWLINGAKIWISYGSHDAADRILHLVLARVPDAAPGTRGLGLFAVPDRLEEAEGGGENGVRALRLEHKMGLHASPTCVLEFENARGWLIGRPGEGVRNLFVMMNAMRLSVAVQGAAAANAATLHAIAYAKERPQGGPPDRPPVPITAHPDVRRMLLEMNARAELLRALALRTAWQLDLAAASGDPAEAAVHRETAELLLPVAKTLGAEIGFEVANQGIQVLGGYGYTTDYPLERLARDIRVASIYEGTSGIQALDFLSRKVDRDGGAVLRRILAGIAEALDAAAPDNPFHAPLRAELTRFDGELDARLGSPAEPLVMQAQAYGFLRLAGQILLAWCGLDLYAGATGDTGHQRRLRDSLRLYAHLWPGETARWREQASLGVELVGHDFG